MLIIRKLLFPRPTQTAKRPAILDPLYVYCTTPGLGRTQSSLAKNTEPTFLNPCPTFVLSSRALNSVSSGAHSGQGTPDARRQELVYRESTRRTVCPVIEKIYALAGTHEAECFLAEKQNHSSARPETRDWYRCAPTRYAFSYCHFPVVTSGRPSSLL